MESDSDRSVIVVTDERWPAVSGGWMYLGSLFIDTRFVTDVCNAFLNARYGCDGWDTVRTDDAWRDADRDDDQVVTFDSCDRDREKRVAERWLSLLRQRFDVTEQLKVRLTGVDLSELDGTTDGKRRDRDDHLHVYSQVLRDHLIDARTQFFGESINVDYGPVYHRQDTDRNDAFAQVLSSISDPLTGIGSPQFLSRDHSTYTPETRGWRTAHLLQMVNVVIGATSNLFSDHHLAHNRAKLAWMQKGLVEDSMAYEEPAADRFTVAFYPKPGTDDRFYYWRDINRSDPHKESLERFM